MVDKLKMLEARINEKKGELEELEKQKEKLERELASLSVVCPSCGGKGWEKYTDAAGDTDTRDCRTCRGLGKVSDIKCERCGNIIPVDMVWLRRQALPQCPWCGDWLGGQYSRL